MSLISWIVKKAVRLALVAGAVKLSLDNNVWSLQTDAGSKAYENLKTYVLPGTIVYKNKLPSSEEMQISVGSKWNQNVKCLFSYIAKLPSITQNKFDEVFNKKSS